MDLTGVASAYTLSPIQATPDQLLLDPTNPRLVTEVAQFRGYSLEELRDPATQNHILEVVCRKEHGVKELIGSIQDLGFISGHQDIIVKRVARDRFLVLEGNRRTAALKHLLKSGGKLRPDVRATIERIQVKEFRYKPNKRFDEAKVIDVLLGSIHIDGPREWGALERATFVHRSYLREYGSRREFQYSVPIARSVGVPFRMSPKMVHKCLVISRVYEQLRKARQPVEPKHFTLIDLATKTRAVAAKYFELDDEACELSARGLERFSELCLGDEPPVHNPNLFNAFVGVFVEGTELELEQVVAGERDAEDVYAAIRVRKARRAFRDDLVAVRQLIGELNVNSFQGTEGERDEIRRIKDLVDGVLVPLVRQAKKAG
jgi:hypothetical protein